MPERFFRDGYRVVGRVPDHLACKKHQAVITEVETASSYAAPQALQKFTAFSTFASSAGVIFHAVIAEESLHAAQRRPPGSPHGEVAVHLTHSVQ